MRPTGVVTVAWRVRDLVMRGDTRAAVDLLVASIPVRLTELHNEALLHASRLSDQERNERLGLLSPHDTSASRQRAGLALLQLLDDIEAHRVDLGVIMPAETAPATPQVASATDASLSFDVSGGGPAREAERQRPVTEDVSRNETVVRDRVFVSYSHADRPWLERLQRMLAPLVRDGSIDLWDDTRIGHGARWREEIESALRHARVAVLLVSDTFLASDFISTQELPRILAAAGSGELTVLWVYVSACLWEETPIGEYQAADDVVRPLEALPESEQREALKRICRAIKEAAE